MAGMPNIVIENKITGHRYCFLEQLPGQIETANGVIAKYDPDIANWDAWHEVGCENGRTILQPITLPLTTGS